MTNRKYGIDVSTYQPSDLKKYRTAGANFAIIKLTEGTKYTNPKAPAQVTSSRANHMYTHAYHFANFGSSVEQAKKEAAYFIREATKVAISKKRILWLDWESSSNNRVTGTSSSNTAAILAFMNAIKKAGWRPGLYSGADILKHSIDTKAIVKNFGACLWVASYPTSEPVSNADFKYFPTMDGVSLWQFTSNWKGLNVDGNITVVELNTKG